MPEDYPRTLDAPLRLEGPLQVGLIGRGISGSLSPRLHSRAAQLAGLPLRFSLVDLDAREDLGPELRRLHAERWRGLSVTMPWKRALDEHLLGMSPDAISIGSVNLLLRAEQGWVGENSDADGFLRPLARRRLDFKRVLVVGAGGAARAVLHVLAAMPFVAAVSVRARRAGEALRLVEEFSHDGCDWTALGWDEAPPAPVDLIVNATPLGTLGALEAEWPCPPAWIRPGAACFDLVYRPRETRFLAAARERGARRIEGLEMLTAQARRAFEAWTGHAFPEAELWRELGLDPVGGPACSAGSAGQCA